jgi:hypothetical protein
MPLATYGRDAGRRGAEPVENRLLRLAAVADNAAMQSEPSNAEPPKRKRRWLQFSLRTLMIATAVVAVACGWLGSKIEQKRRQRSAVAELIKSGSQVNFDYQKSQAGYDTRAEPFGPAWLRALLGDNFFSEADCIYCLGGLENLEEFPHLRLLRIMMANRVTDDGLKYVKGLTELQDLVFIDTEVSNSAVGDLRKALPKTYIVVLHQFPKVSRKDYPPSASASK